MIISKWYVKYDLCTRSLEGVYYDACIIGGETIAAVERKDISVAVVVAYWTIVRVVFVQSEHVSELELRNIAVLYLAHSLRFYLCFDPILLTDRL